MAVLTWDDIAERFYEAGVSKGVLYPMDASGDYPLGVAWNGLVNVTEQPSGAEATPLYADNIKYLNLLSAEELGLSLEAFTYPAEFEACDGLSVGAPGVAVGQQPRQSFGLVYVTEVGNDVDGIDHGYKIHLVYGCLASPSEKAFGTINDSPEAVTFNWDIATTPESVTGHSPASILIIDSRTAGATQLAAMELTLFGDVATSPNLPHINAVITAMTP